MDQTVATGTTPLSKVDSLYGPGTVIGWYLTLLACITSWTLHPEKKKRDSIDADLIVSLTPPVLAVFHLLSQISRLSRQNDSYAQITGTSDPRQATADAIEAPLVIIEAFMNITVLMFMIAAWSIAIRRAIVVGIAGLVCFAADWYVNTSTVNLTGLNRLFARNFVADSAMALIAISVILGLLLLTTLALATYFLHDRHREHELNLRQLESENLRLELHLEAHVQNNASTMHPDLSSIRMERIRRDSRAMKSMTVVTMLYLPLTLMASLMSFSFPAGLFNEWYPTTPRLPTRSDQLPYRLSAPSVKEWLIPRSPSSLRDLDQKAALLGGLTALAFSIYSTLAIRIRHWLKAQRRERRLREQDNVRLRRLLLDGQVASSE